MSRFTTPRLQGALLAASLAMSTACALADQPGAVRAPSATVPAGASAAPAADAANTDASSYSIGLAFGNQLRGAGLDKSVSAEALVRGLKEGLNGKLLSDEDKARAMQLYRSGREAVAAHN